MPRYVVRYTEVVTYEVTINAEDKHEATKKLKNGDYTEVFEIDSYLHNIISVDNNRELLESLGLTLADCKYNRLQELAKTHTELKYHCEMLSDIENDCLGFENNSVMYQLQFMYHGETDGKHSASVAAALNLEAPYHRPGHCELAKEVEITWKNQKELKEKLVKALSKVTKAIF